jgi:hypothetical protein
MDPESTSASWTLGVEREMDEIAHKSTQAVPPAS